MFRCKTDSGKKPAIPDTYIEHKEKNGISAETLRKIYITSKMLIANDFLKMQDIIRMNESDAIEMVGDDYVKDLKSLKESQYISGYKMTIDMKIAVLWNFYEYVTTSISLVDLATLDDYSKMITHLAYQNKTLILELQRIHTQPNQCSKEFGGFLANLHHLIIQQRPEEMKKPEPISPSHCP